MSDEKTCTFSSSTDSFVSVISILIDAKTPALVFATAYAENYPSSDNVEIESVPLSFILIISFTNNYYPL